MPPGFTTSQPSDPGQVTAPCLSVYVNTLARQDKQSTRELVVYSQEKDRSIFRQTSKTGAESKVKTKAMTINNGRETKKCKNKNNHRTLSDSIVYYVYTHSNLTVNTDLFKVLK